MQRSCIFFIAILFSLLLVPIAHAQWSSNTGSQWVYLNTTTYPYSVGVGAGPNNSQGILAKFHVANEALFGPTSGLTVGPSLGAGNLSIAGSSSGVNVWKRTLTDLSNSTTAGNRWMWYNPDGSLRLYTGTTGDVVTVLTSGYVGIGTVSPSNLLTVNGKASFGGTTANVGAEPIEAQGSGAGISMFDRVGGSTERWAIYSTRSGGAGTNTLRFFTNSQDRLAITPAGNVGLGTVSPLNKLDVSGGAVIGATYSGTNTAPTNGMLVQGNMGIATTTPQNKLDVSGGAVIGATYAGTNTAPTNGMLIQGNVGIGTTSLGSAKLAVEGLINTREVKVTATGTAFPDYVFDDGYILPPLDELARTIKQDKHLPEMPSAGEVKENGMNLGEMQVKLLKKIEELTLYVIDLKKENEFLKNRMDAFAKR